LFGFKLGWFGLVGFWVGFLFGLVGLGSCCFTNMTNSN
jgi:hypothetical protein